MSCLVASQAAERLEHEQLMEKIQDLERSTGRVGVGVPVVLVALCVCSWLYSISPADVTILLLFKESAYSKSLL